MLLKLHTPNPPLSDFVELFTYYEDYAPTHSVERVLPEGVVEIIIDLTDEPKWMHDNETLKHSKSYRWAWVSGMRSRFISIGVAGRSAMFIIRFKSGKAYPFLQMPVSEIDNQVVDSDAVFDSAFASYRTQLIEAPTPRRKFQVAENFILQRIRNHFEIHPAVSYVVNEVMRNPSTATIGCIIQQTGYTHKHLLSLFNKYVGLSPKQFVRLTRFQHAVLHIERSKQIDWMQVANDCGYYDQSHFIKDFKEFSGFSPSEYVQRKYEFVNYVPML
jgi:AraC-like DNA-binding protein